MGLLPTRVTGPKGADLSHFEKKFANHGEPFKFQLCNHTSPGTQMLWFPGSFLPSLQKKRRQIASWHRLWLELGRYLIAFEPLTFVLD